MVKKGIFAVLDQGSFSFSIFIVNILLIRWLNTYEYGAFAIAYSIFILIQAISLGFIYEPMAIFGQGKYKGNLLKYLNSVIVANIFISSILFIVIIIFAAVFLKTATLKYAFLGMGIGMPGILFFHLVRRFFYIKLEPLKATSSSVISSTGILFVIVVLKFFNLLSSFTVFIALGFICLISSLIILKLFHPSWRFQLHSNDLRKVIFEHLKYGRWITGSHLITWVPSGVYMVILPFFIGVEGSGVLKALINFSLPVQQFVGALNLLFLPKSSKMYAEKKSEELKRMVLVYTKSIFYLTTIYWIFLAICSNSLIEFIYKGKYLEYANLLWLVGLLPLLTTVCLPVAYTLRAMNRPDKIFLSSIFTAVSTLLGLIFISFLEIKGAILGLLISSAVNCLCLFYWYNKTNHNISADSNVFSVLKQ